MNANSPTARRIKDGRAFIAPHECAVGQGANGRRRQSQLLTGQGGEVRCVIAIQYVRCGQGREVRDDPARGENVLGVLQRIGVDARGEIHPGRSQIRHGQTSNG